MNDLPVPASQGNSKTPASSAGGQNSNSKQDDALVSGVSLGTKEVEPGSINPQEGLHDATGGELELPKEVVSSGVRIQPTTVPIPPPVAHMGVKPAGSNVPVQTTTTVALPLTDDQIAIGLHQSITNSWRWLSQWCLRQLKHFHLSLKSVQGKVIRVKT